MARLFQREKDGPWWADFADAEGKRRRINTKVRKRRVAQEILDALVTKVARREHLGVIDETRTSFAEAADRWIEYLKSGKGKRRKEATLVAYETAIRRRLAPSFTGALRSISRAQVEEHIAARTKAGAAPGTIRQEIAVLKALLGWAVREGLIARNPLAGRLEALPEEVSRTRFLSLDEIDALLEACDATPPGERVPGAYLRGFVLVSLNTGMRRSEVLSLSRATVDLERGLAYLADTKANRPRHVRLNQTAREALEALPAPLEASAPYFPFKGLDVTRAFAKAAKRAEIEGATVHTLRHTSASHLVMAGEALTTVQAVLGHATISMTERYAHLSPSFVAAAVDRLQIGNSSARRGENLAPMWHRGGGVERNRERVREDAPARNRTWT